MADAITYQRVWNKYLPVIVMKLRTAVKSNEPQALNLDKYDFENAGVRKNAAFKFNLELKEGRAINNSNGTAMARDFALAMNEHEVAKDMIKTGHFTFSMGNKFILTIQKN
jgi:hypothetical protein